MEHAAPRKNDGDCRNDAIDAQGQCDRGRVVPADFGRGQDRNERHEDDRSNGSGQAVSAQLCLAKLSKRGTRHVVPQTQIRARRRRSAFPITDTELKLIASAAISGESSQPVSG